MYGKNEPSICELMTNKGNNSLPYCHLRIGLKCQIPLLSYVQERVGGREGERERGKMHCKCTMYCTVHFTTLFNVGNVLLCVI